jgi:hypothetical protein
VAAADRLNQNYTKHKLRNLTEMIQERGVESGARCNKQAKSKHDFPVSSRGLKFGQSLSVGISVQELFLVHGQILPIGLLFCANRLDHIIFFAITNGRIPVINAVAVALKSGKNYGKTSKFLPDRQ